MSNGDELDLIVVGAGPAGLACAFEAASRGLQVAVLERGDVAGSKSLSGGRLYLGPLRGLVGDLLEGAPFERQVVSESIVLAGQGAGLTIRLDGQQAEAPAESVTVLRAKLDAFLADRAAEKGAMVMGQQRVEALVREGDKIAGVLVGPEQLRAETIVAADGALSFVAAEAGLKPERPAHAFGVGVKETIRLDAEAIEERFNLAPGHGASRLYLGEVTRGLPGGGFLYTNAESLSLGLVVNAGALQGWQSEEKLWELMERFKERPEIAPLVAGGETVEYGAHLVPEAGLAGVPSRLGLPGLLLAGDAAGLVLNTGSTVRGMDLALASGTLAGRAVADAREAKESPAACLARYEEALGASFVMRELRAHRGAPEALALERIYNHYPKEVVRLAQGFFRVAEDGVSMSPRGAFGLLRRDVFQGWRGVRDAWRLRKI